jgi:hypothetical protein
VPIDEEQPEVAVFQLGGPGLNHTTFVRLPDFHAKLDDSARLKVAYSVGTAWAGENND